LDKFIQIIEENELQPGDIEGVRVQPAPVVQFKLWQENTLRTPEDYCFSTPYLLACAAYRINPARWQDLTSRKNPEIGEFMQRVPISVTVDEGDFTLAKLEDPKSYQQRIEVKAKGKTYQGKMPYPKGSWQPRGFRNTDEELVDKFRNNVSNVLPTNMMEKAVDVLLGLEDLENVNQLMRIFTP
jgi:2-methylcitrate dehydratase PrpD